ncbi:MAG: response regulator [Bdellovibrionota bacterium]
MNSHTENNLVVLVEDDEAIRAAFTEVLESEGFNILAFRNGREALEKLEDRPEPCLILLDWMMPVMNGEQFLEARSHSEVSALKNSTVVVISAMAQLARRFPGVAELVNKPVDIDGLISVVRRHKNVSA